MINVAKIGHKPASRTPAVSTRSAKIAFSEKKAPGFTYDFQIIGQRPTPAAWYH